jgi:hypothetical protein
MSYLGAEPVAFDEALPDLRAQWDDDEDDWDDESDEDEWDDEDDWEELEEEFEDDEDERRPRKASEDW